MFKRLTLLFVIVFLAACSKPVPKSKTSYVGEWYGKDMTLQILADGSVSYQRQEDGVSTSLNAPIKEFEGDDFIVGIGPMSTTFVVNEPPHEIDGIWSMVVDGVKLTKRSEK